MDIRKKFVAEWEKYTGQTPDQDLIDVVLTTDAASKTVTIVEVPFENTFIKMDFKKEESFKVIKTVFGSASAFESANINFRPAEILTLIDENGNKRIDYLSKEELLEIVQLFAVKYYIWEKIDNAKLLEFEDILSNDNMAEEVKGLCFSTNNLDLSKVLEKVDTYVSDIENHKKQPIVYDLFKGTVMDQKVSYVRTFDASTDRMFFLAVPNTITKAIDAPACLVKVPEKLKKHIKEIRRQGEKYTVTWDVEVGSDKFNKLYDSKLVPLDGETYFSKLVYEA